MKKLWFYTKGKWKEKATLTNLRPMITRDPNVEAFRETPVLSVTRKVGLELVCRLVSVHPY